jgi:hypothetical protein
MRAATACLLALLALCLFAAPAPAEWDACDGCHQGGGGDPPTGFPYGVCAHCHHVIDFGPQHDPDDPTLVCSQCHTKDGLHYVHHWESACQECHGPVHINTPRVYELQPTQSYTYRVVEIRGTNFGDTQGSSIIRLGKKRYRSTNPNVLFWSNTEIRFLLPMFSAWPSGATHTRKVWVNVGGVASNKKVITITQP